ncbi:MAG TPA: hypothetical protein VHD56_12720 [Tepidisphaeraceae bacterium]|nr:hypothetical protein [Tepidisphaeraceae bacterium]
MKVIGREFEAVRKGECPTDKSGVVRLQKMGRIQQMNEIIFLVEDEPSGGFTARALGESIFTEGQTRDELLDNIREAVACHFGDADRAPLAFSDIRWHVKKEAI